MCLLRDIHDFLNYHGFINMGVASKKPRLSSGIQAGVKSSDCHKARPTEGLATEDKKLADRDAEAQTITSVSPCFAAYRRKEASADQELATAGSEQKKKLRHGKVVHECPDEAVVDTMVIAKKPAVKGLKNKLAEPDLHCQSVYSGTEAGSELTTVRPSDEEFLLDIKNRIKARNRKKKQSLQEMLAPLEFKCQQQGKEVRMTKCDGTKVKIKGKESRAPMVEGISSCNQVSVAVSAHDKQPLRKKVIVVGAGAAGLAAARHLQNMDIQVTVLEARDRVGGRVFTDHSSFSGPVDLGASVVTGVEADLATERRPDPAALLCKQLNLELTFLQGDCPLFDVVKGAKVPADTDKALEAEFNCLLDETAKLVVENESLAKQMSLEEGLKLVYKKHKALAKPDPAGKKLKVDQAGQVETIRAAKMLFSKQSADFSLAQRVMSWHFANLEHQCGAELNKISLPYWNHDNAYGGFAGPHCMINGGFSAVMEALGADLEIHLKQVVSKIDYTCKDDQSGGVGEILVQTTGGAAFYADAVLLTVPLGYMKSDLIEYSPPLPDWKIDSIQQLGFGLLTKVVMEFPVAFWDETVDSFGCTAELNETRGRCFLFWNLKNMVGFPILSTLVAGKAAVEDEQKEGSEVLEHALQVLRKLFGETAVPQPTAFTVTKWGSDPYSRGAYSYVAVGASDKERDILGQPVENRIFFAGEATCKEHPDTVGGAMMSGLREAVRILDVLHNRANLLSEAEALGASEGQSNTGGDEVKEIVERLTDVGVSSATKKAGGKLGRPLSKASLLQGLFGVPKTNSGRLLLAKEMLQLPESSLRAFLNTKAGLVVLNSWIQGSMGKNGGQLLRLCLQLLVVAGSPPSLVQRSGIELTLKDKVLRHSSRDIRATASQLLKLWMEATSKGKAARDLASPMHKGKAACDLASPMQNSASCQKVKQKKKVNDVKLLSSQAEAACDLASSMQNSASCQKVKQKKRVKDVKVPSSQADAVLKDHLYHPLDCGKDILQGSPERQTQASGCLNTKDSAPEAKEGNGPELENFGQALELSTPIVKVEPIAAKVTEVAAKVHESMEAARPKQPELPKILSFQKFAKRDHIDTSKRKPLLRETLILYGKDLVTSGADARQSKVRDWSIDFSDSCSYLGSPRLLAMLDNASSRDGFSAVMPNMPDISSTDIAGERHESGLTSNQDEVLPNSKETTDDASAGSSMRGSHRRQSGVCLASLNSGNMPLNTTLLIEDDKPVKFVSDHHRCSDAQRLGASICNHPSADAEKRDSQSHSAERRPDSAEDLCCSLNEVNDASAGSSVRLAAEKRNEILKTKEHFASHLLLDGEKRSSSMVFFSKPETLEQENFCSDRSEQVKKAVTEYLAHLLTPLYKTKRINKESFKSIMKKAITKVMERRTEEEVAMGVTEFMDTKRKIKIRSLIDKLVERYLENVHRH
eukprot:c24714_g1_i1 orf=917-5227(-)